MSAPARLCRRPKPGQWLQAEAGNKMSAPSWLAFKRDLAGIESLGVAGTRGVHRSARVAGMVETQVRFTEAAQIIKGAGDFSQRRVGRRSLEKRVVRDRFSVGRSPVERVADSRLSRCRGFVRVRLGAVLSGGLLFVFL